MIPFLGMGTDQLAENKVGEPRTGDSVKFEGEDGFQTRWKGSCRAFSELVTTITVPSTSTSQKEKKNWSVMSTPYH